MMTIMMMMIIIIINLFSIRNIIHVNTMLLTLAGHQRSYVHHAGAYSSVLQWYLAMNKHKHRQIQVIMMMTMVVRVVMMFLTIMAGVRFLQDGRPIVLGDSCNWMRDSCFRFTAWRSGRESNPCQREPKSEALPAKPSRHFMSDT